MRRLLYTAALVTLFGCSDELPALPDAGTPADQGQTDAQVVPLDGTIIVADAPEPEPDLDPATDLSVPPLDLGPTPDAGCPPGECYTGTECASLMPVPCEDDPSRPANASNTTDTIMAVCDPQGSGDWIIPPSYCNWECDPGFMLDNMTNNGCVVDPDNAIVIFSAGSYTTALGGRTGSNALCENAASALGFSSSYRGKIVSLLSVDANDEIRDLPFNFGVRTDQPVVSMKSYKIAENFLEMLGGSILLPLKDAGVSDAAHWYSGSTVDGGVAPHTCNGWTVLASYTARGEYGYTTVTDFRWISQGASGAVCANVQYDLLCLAYVP